MDDKKVGASMRDFRKHAKVTGRDKGWVSMSERRPAIGEVVALYDAMFDKVNVCVIDCEPEKIDPDYTHWIRTPSVDAALAEKGKP